jgi:hypothetical protein
MEFLDSLNTLLFGNTTQIIDGIEYTMSGAWFQAIMAIGAVAQGISGSRKAKKQSRAAKQEVVTQNNLAVADDRRQLQLQSEDKTISDFNKEVSALASRSEAQLALSEKGISGASAETVISNYLKSTFNEKLLSKLEFENLLNESNIQQENRKTVLNQNLRNIKASAPSQTGIFINTLSNIVGTGIFGGKS